LSGLHMMKIRLTRLSNAVVSAIAFVYLAAVELARPGHTVVRATGASRHGRWLVTASSERP